MPIQTSLIEKSARPTPSKKNAETAWLKTRRALLRHVKSEVQKRLGSRDERDVADFSLRYDKELKRSWKISTQTELLQKIESSNLVYGGDFHALAQSQRTHLRLLRALSQPVVIALECFRASAQTYLDQYVFGKLTLDQLRLKSKWDLAWGFEWDHYRPLFELAKAKRFQMIGLNSVTSLKSSQRNGHENTKKNDLDQREICAAKILAKTWAESKTLVYVIFGDLHLAPSHLPAKVRFELTKGGPLSARRLLRPSRDVHDLHEITIHLNSERVYFQLARRGLENAVDVVKFSEKSFCVLSTPPWVKWQSYLLFLDAQSVAKSASKTASKKVSIGAHSGDQRLDGDGDFDATDQVALFVRLAAGDLGLGDEFKQINDLAVYGEDDDVIWRTTARLTNASDREMAQSLLKAGQRFFIPRGGVAFQPRPTINSAAALAGLYLHARLSRRTHTLWSFPGDLQALIWTEGVSYLVSKMINHSRRSETVASLRTKLQMKRQISAETRRENPEALRLALDVRLSEIVRLQTGRVRALQNRPRRKSSYVEASRILGGMLGERLYVAYRSRKLKRETLISWLRHDPGRRAFHELYDEIVEHVANLAPQS